MSGQHRSRDDADHLLLARPLALLLAVGLVPPVFVLRHHIPTLSRDWLPVSISAPDQPPPQH
ncbi:hypothetical protein ACGFRG_08110 [Streptomyces sp. NPDC048696]|uniref:hypothetical protein n=1 Tax=Streptomyces sp. NPDC048696 TaxID=3365585 RepID=UPI003719638A